METPSLSEMSVQMY